MDLNPMNPERTPTSYIDEGSVQTSSVLYPLAEQSLTMVICDILITAPEHCPARVPHLVPVHR